METSLGICVGSSTINIVGLAWRDGTYEVVESLEEKHDSEAVASLARLLDQVDYDSYDYLTVTGCRLKENLNAPTITEPEATRYALGERNGHDAVVSAGSENFILYQLSESGEILQVQTGNKCASGTGEFFLQQIGRMGVDVETAISLAEDSEPYRVSGRCSVFCKSDCTHALNKGIPIGRVCAGLGDMIAEKIVELATRIRKNRLLIVGGVTRNRYIMNRLRESLGSVTIPEHASVFEALGAAIYARENRIKHVGSVVATGKHSSFTRYTPLSEGEPLVTFSEHQRRSALQGEECLLGLDVGSTTTKAVLMASADDAILASVYLRTEGNPVAASRNCYGSILKELGGTEVKISGLGVTGSGRKIAGLHAQTDAVINEIIAHATGATFFDDRVDTILEIGGQDAKYTYLVNGVPCDYAMNEACSAGTGSFIEEAAKEALDIHYLDIQDIAMDGQAPPNFNDQCAAFISSDIKNAIHENIQKPDIVAGLAYSICLNYINRVKGQRKIGEHIFMQGGVCYNRAIPLAMALLIDKPIVVPPDPGLIGAFGVALETKNRIGTGLLSSAAFDLAELRDREVAYGKSFVCTGGKEMCDRGCVINVVKINGSSSPFGGACDRYYNAQKHRKIDVTRLNYVKKRQDLVFSGRNPLPVNQTVGIPRSFTVNTLYPLYHRFFSELGFQVVLSDDVDPDGVAMATASFCYPAEIAHGMFLNLVKREPDFIFLPHLQKPYVEKNKDPAFEGRSSCVIIQGEPYYLRSAFRNIKPKIVTAVLNFEQGWGTTEKEFVDIGRQVGKRRNEAKRAFELGRRDLEEFQRRNKELGRQFIAELDSDPTRIGIVLFGRAYNAFAPEGNLCVPEKFASRGVMIVPFDCLDFADEEITKNMNWATGQDLMKASRLVSRHPQLYATYVSNFSCGPDAIMVGYFRDILGSKPSLTLELDSHSADAGINTRIEAFLDIVDRVRNVKMKQSVSPPFVMAETFLGEDVPHVRTSDGGEIPLTDPRVKVVFPSMNSHLSRIGAACFNGFGIRSEAVPVPTFTTLMEGRRFCSGKECLPLQLTTGSMMEYLQTRDEDEITVYFMPTAAGNCRFSQYSVFQEMLIQKQRIPNVGLLALNSENSYAGFSRRMVLETLRGLIVADVADEMRNALLVLAVDPDAALEIFDEQFTSIESAYARREEIDPVLRRIADELGRIELKYTIDKARRVLISGEIYVRKDEFSSQALVERLADHDIVAIRSPMLEWIYYIDYFVKHLLGRPISFGERLELMAKQLIVPSYERRIRRTFAATGLVMRQTIDVAKVVETGKHLVNPELAGETVLTLGSMFKDVLHEHHGMISAGPFGCMPSKIVESILTNETLVRESPVVDQLPNADEIQRFETLPFLSVECDGNPFPPLIESRIEAFALQVDTLHRSLHELELTPRF